MPKDRSLRGSRAWDGMELFWAFGINGLAIMPQMVYAIRMISDFPDLLSHWSNQELADDLGVPYTAAAAMRHRGVVAAVHWERLVHAARGKSLDISAEMLARFARERKTHREAAE